MGGSKRNKQKTFSDKSTHPKHSNEEGLIQLQALECKLESLINNNSQRLIDNIEVIRGTLHELIVEQDNIKIDVGDLKDQRSIPTDKVFCLRYTIQEFSFKVNGFSRRANVRVFGLKDKKDETSAATVNAVTEIIRTKLNWREFNPSQIDVAHRIGPYRNNADRAVIVRFYSHTTATEVKRRRRNLKGRNIVLTEDLTPER
ncbi:Sh3 domain protein [Plakobranchus ocellatus]|uniref:Sh3 domain protein n=1 Tax=Plakobranchus ocellatus TaxID=259542 RepID=A0AAV4DAA0_9GAST|nr:Sh3 domain protein [Plakobranchus ocellatus]